MTLNSTLRSELLPKSSRALLPRVMGSLSWSCSLCTLTDGPGSGPAAAVLLGVTACTCATRVAATGEQRTGDSGVSVVKRMTQPQLDDAFLLWSR